MSGLKTHGKTALVVRKEGGGLRSYVHIGRGNYHVKTARLYADLGLLTCAPQLTRDVINLFHYLTGRSSKEGAIQALAIAPSAIRPALSSNPFACLKCTSCSGTSRKGRSGLYH